jgi:hypothetical protein
MRYMLLERREQEELLAALDAMVNFLDGSLRGLDPKQAVRRPTDGGFAPVEHCWHLADLEREGFGERIRRLIAEGDNQEGVGRVSLCDLPAMMAEHDASHRSEIEAWGSTI